MKTLLLCGYRAQCNTAAAGEILLETRIRELQMLDMEVICVLAGHEADEILRACPAIEKCELVFDTLDNPSLISNARAGAIALAQREAAFLLPVEVPPPERAIWQFLRNEYGKAGSSTPISLFQAIDPREGAPKHHGFPLLVTQEGAKVLQSAPSLTDLVDPRLKYLHLPYAPMAELAS